MQEAEGFSRDDWPEVLPAWAADPWALGDSDGGSQLGDSDSTPPGAKHDHRHCHGHDVMRTESLDRETGKDRDN